MKAFGATGNGRTMDRAAIQAAVDACHKAGGGCVYLPPGTYRSGAIQLKSNVRFFLEAGALLQGTDDLADYAPPHLLSAEDAEDVSVEGLGIIDGCGPSFWFPKPGGRDPNFKPERQGWGEIVGFWWDYKERPEQMLRFTRCRNVRVSDVTLRNAPFWTFHVLNCDDVAIRGVTIWNPIHGPNTDGIDIDASRNVRVADCRIDTGDDAIVLKNTRSDLGSVAEVPASPGDEPDAHRDAVRPPEPGRGCRNITVTNCIITTNCNALKIGTESRDPFENIAFSNCVLDNEPGDPGRQAISGIAVEMVDGSRLSGVVCSNIVMRNVRAPFFIRLGNRGTGQAIPTPGTLEGVLIENIRATGASIPATIAGIPGHPVRGVTVSNVRITTTGGGTRAMAEREIPEREGNYPDASMFGRPACYGLFVRHAEGIRIANVDLASEAPDERPAIDMIDVSNLDVDGLRVASANGKLPVMRLKAVRNARIRNCPPTGSPEKFMEVAGCDNVEMESPTRSRNP